MLFTNLHDFHLAQQILKTVLEHAIKNGLKNVSKVRLELGSIIEHGAEILPENLIHNFKLLAKDTPAEKVKLEIKIAKGNSWKLIDIEGEK